MIRRTISGGSKLTLFNAALCLSVKNMPWDFLPFQRLHSTSCEIVSRAPLENHDKSRTYSSKVFIVDMSLLQRALDLFLGVVRKRVKTVDQLEVLSCALPPVVEDRRRDTAPGKFVSIYLNS